MEPDTEQLITAKDKLTKIDELLDSYEKQSGLPTCKSPGTEEELNSYLSMNLAETEKLTPDLCSQLIFRLSQYAFYLKRLSNREKTRAIWARQELNNTVAKELASYDKYMKFDMKIALITQNNTYAYNIQRILTYAEERFQRLDGLADYIKHLSDSIKAVSFNKIQMLRNP